MRNFLAALDEYLNYKDSDAALRDSIPETALFLEDTCGIRLNDSELTERELGSAAAVRSLVMQRIGVAQSPSTCSTDKEGNS